MRTTLITAHAVTATVALLAVLGGRRTWWFAVHYAGLVAMLVLLVAAIAVDLPGRAAGELVVDGLLVGLGIVMIAHTEGARRVRRHDPRRFVERLGFSVVGLVDAFVVVTVFGIAPGWVAAIVGVAIAVVGHLAIGAAAGRTTPRRRCQEIQYRRNATPSSDSRSGTVRSNTPPQASITDAEPMLSSSQVTSTGPIP